MDETTLKSLKQVGKFCLMFALAISCAAFCSIVTIELAATWGQWVYIAVIAGVFLYFTFLKVNDDNHREEARKKYLEKIRNIPPGTVKRYLEDRHKRK